MNSLEAAQDVPFHATVSGLELSGDPLLHHVANGAGAGVGDTKHLVLVIARCRHECQVRAVRIPLDVRPFPAPAGDVVAERGAMLVCRHLETNRTASAHQC